MAIKEKHFCQTKNGLYTPAVEMKVICRTESRVLLMCNYAFCVVKTGCALSLSLSLIVGKASESDYNFKRLITKICLSCKKKISAFNFESSTIKSIFHFFDVQLNTNAFVKLFMEFHAHFLRAQNA